MIPSQTSPCTQFYVHLNPDTRTPILGTMFSKDTDLNNINQHLIARLPNTQMSHVNQCWPPTKLRYWYKVSKQTGKILPNSMFTSTKKVAQCSGQYTILEYVIYSCN